MYHLDLGTKTHDLQKMFGDVRFVCMGGSNQRMKEFAYYLKDVLNYELPTGATLQDLTEKSKRFSMYKVGPVISVSHGMGESSIGILLNEIIKLMHYAKAKDPIFFRIGTCGGIGNGGGTVIVSNGAVDGLGNEFYAIPVLGKILKRPAIFDQDVVKEVMDSIDENDVKNFPVVTGRTMSCLDFYEGEARVDGAFCRFTEKEKLDYLKHLQAQGVANMEMEAIPFAALTHEAGIKAVDVCISYLDRLKGDQVNASKDLLVEWEKRPQKIVANFIKKKIQVAD